MQSCRNFPVVASSLGRVALAGVVLLAACSTPPDPYPVPEAFKPTPDLARIAAAGVYKWSDTAPFARQWDPYANAGKNTLVITNTGVIFPYMGTWHEGDGFEVGGLTDDTTKDAHYIYQSTSTYYKDPDWGPVEVYAALRYQSDPVWLDRFYTVNGALMDLLPGGTGQSGLPSGVEITPTRISAVHPHYRTEVFTADTPSAGTSIFAFYQQGQLILEVGYRCRDADQPGCVAKLGEIATRMGLDIPEWQNATPADLSGSATSTLFWDAQLKPVVIDMGSGASVELKFPLAAAGFKQVPAAHAATGTASFAKAVSGGSASLHLRVHPTSLGEAAFAKQTRGLVYRHDYDVPVFLQAVPATRAPLATGTAKAYFTQDRQGYVVDFTYRYPAANQAARDQLQSLVKALAVDDTD